MFSSILLIDRTLSDASTPDQNEPGSDVNEGVSPLSKAPALRETHHQII